MVYLSVCSSCPRRAGCKMADNGLSHLCGHAQERDKALRLQKERDHRGIRTTQVPVAKRPTTPGETGQLIDRHQYTPTPQQIRRNREEYERKRRERYVDSDYKQERQQNKTTWENYSATPSIYAMGRDDKEYSRKKRRFSRFQI